VPLAGLAIKVTPGFYLIDLSNLALLQELKAAVLVGQ
jgi:hypothetical protein